MSNTALLGSYGAQDSSSLMFRNKVINGDMRIDQRNAGASVTGEGYLVDRWRVWRDQSYSIGQSTDAPTGFSNSLLVTKTSTVQSSYGYLIQYIEGFNFSDMLFGTANAKSVTLSFWVKSSVTGSFTVGLANSAENRNYPATYTINAANTWEYKTITISGDTTGTWIGSTNGKGVGVWFNFGATGSGAANTWSTAAVIVASTGSANLGTTNGATFAITGVQLEAGPTATPFERRPIGVELQLAMRYYQVKSTPSNGSSASGNSAAGNNSFYTLPLPVPLRASPGIATTGSFSFRTGGTDNTVNGLSVAGFDALSVQLQGTHTSLSNGLSGSLFSSGGATTIALSAEL